MQNKKFGAFSSSVNPQEFSKTFESLITIFATLLATVGALKGIPAVISNDQINQVVQAFTAVVSSGITIWHFGQFVFGLVRKVMARS